VSFESNAHDTGPIKVRRYYLWTVSAEMKNWPIFFSRQKLDNNKKYFQMCLKSWWYIGGNHTLWLVGGFCLKYPGSGTTRWRSNWLKYMKLMDFYMIQVIGIIRT